MNYIGEYETKLVCGNLARWSTTWLGRLFPLVLPVPLATCVAGLCGWRAKCVSPTHGEEEHRHSVLGSITEGLDLTSSFPRFEHAVCHLLYATL